MILATMALGAAETAAIAGPAYRIENTMVYDSIGRRHIVFGGYDSHYVTYQSATRFNDIWEYDGATRTWYNVTPRSGAMPSARSGHAMAFDPARRVVVMYGGWNQTQGYLNDTWEWHCATRTWTRTGSTAPSARRGIQITYDVVGARMLLFGGVDDNRHYNETWQYSASAWTRITTTNSSPTGRAFVGRTYHGQVYNSATGRITIFGGVGFPASGGSTADFNDLWELRGTTWVDITPSGTKPGGRGWFGMSYEAATNRIVVYGGWTVVSGFSYTDTWAWNGSSWSLLIANSAPGARDSFAMTYDAPRARTVLFGGYWGEPWELTGSTWTSITATDGNPAASGPLTPDGDGDGLADLVVYRPSSGQWFVRLSSAGYSSSAAQTYSFGASTDRPVVGDYDGDGLFDQVLWRPSTGQWLARGSMNHYSASAQVAHQWGLQGDTPIGADFDGDGRNDLVVYRPSSGEWFVLFSSSGYAVASSARYQWGLQGDVPMAADYDGDRRADLAVYRPSTGEWYIRYSSLNYSTSAITYLGWGMNSDKPLAADFDGDGRADVAIYRPSNGGWYILRSSTGYAVGGYQFVSWGLGSDVPLAPMDFDGDRRADVVVMRPSTGEWYVRYSSQNYGGSYAVYQWGVPGDTAVLSR